MQRGASSISYREEELDWYPLVQSGQVKVNLAFHHFHGLLVLNHCVYKFKVKAASDQESLEHCALPADDGRVSIINFGRLDYGPV